MDPNDIVTVVNRTSKTRQGTHDGRPYDLPPGESQHPLFKAYYFRYQNFTLNGGYVISSANVLSAVPVPVSYVTSHPIKSCLDESKPETCTDGYAIDTLSPIGGDWGLIRGYVEQILAD